MARCGEASTAELFPGHLASEGRDVAAPRGYGFLRRAALILGAGLVLLLTFLAGRAVEQQSEIGQVLALEQRTIEMWDLVGVADSLRLELLRHGIAPDRLYPAVSRSSARAR